MASSLTIDQPSLACSYPLLQFIVRFQVMSTFFNGNPYPG
jgi:hypothetical protein